jgi:hypothetical protein
LAVLLLAALAATVVQPPRPQARATVRIIMRPVRVSKETWPQLQPKQRREVVVIRDGQPVKLRLMEFE